MFKKTLWMYNPFSVYRKPNLVPRSHSVLHGKVRSPFPLAVGDLGTRLQKTNIQ